jgi:cobalt/nickel transport system ATP-binding protein
METLMSELLTIQNISYFYEDKKPALSNVSASFHRGELVAVLGSNGAGKSTFFLCCNGVLSPQQGKILFDGTKILSKKDLLRLRQGVGLVFQDPDSQIIAGSVAAEISFGPMNLRLPKAEVVKRVDEAMMQMNIEKYRDQAPHYLSGGEKKRVSIADILAMKPEIILLDEPTASLDPYNAAMLENILVTLSQAGISILISTHDVNLAYRIANRAIVFSAGEIIADEDIETVFSKSTILKRAGLSKPLLYEAWECISAVHDNLSGMKKPRTITEFKEYFKKHG